MIVLEYPKSEFNKDFKQTSTFYEMLHFNTAYTGKKPADPNPIGRELPKTDI
jgi:hypothetical protein